MKQLKSTPPNTFKINFDFKTLKEMSVESFKYFIWSFANFSRYSENSLLFMSFLDEPCFDKETILYQFAHDLNSKNLAEHTEKILFFVKKKFSDPNTIGHRGSFIHGLFYNTDLSVDQKVKVFKSVMQAVSRNKSNDPKDFIRTSLKILMKLSPADLNKLSDEMELILGICFPAPSIKNLDDEKIKTRENLLDNTLTVFFSDFRKNVSEFDKLHDQRKSLVVSGFFGELERLSKNLAPFRKELIQTITMFCKENECMSGPNNDSIHLTNR